MRSEVFDVSTSRLSKRVSDLGVLLASWIVVIGTFWAFKKGANDFSVFYEAWSLVLQGRGADIYHATPDRFLYAPGFAWILAPLGVFPKNVALAVWCLAKAAVMGFLVRSFASSSDRNGPRAALGLSAWGVVLLARPILIDFQYGQINTLILGACAWGLLNHFRSKKADFLDLLSWAVLAIVGLAKLFPLPLLLVPFFMTSTISAQRIRLERLGIVLGGLLIGAAPLISQGFQGTLDLYLKWKDALLAKGLPLESHNQSFAAFLHHYFSGMSTHVIARGIEHPVSMGGAWLSSHEIWILSLAWILITFGILLGWLLNGASKAPLRWVAVSIALLILPSHLIWKPYFLMGLPVAMLAVSSKRPLLYLLIPLFFLENFSGFDWVGSTLGAWLEGGSLLLWVHLCLIGMVAWGQSESYPRAALRN